MEQSVPLQSHIQELCLQHAYIDAIDGYRNQWHVQSLVEEGKHGY